MTIADKRKEYRLINILFRTIYKKKSAKWRGDYLRNKHIFHQIGNNVHLWGGVPSDPYLISIGNNVIIAVSVEFVTHDIFYHALNQRKSLLCLRSRTSRSDCFTGNCTGCTSCGIQQKEVRGAGYCSNPAGSIERIRGHPSELEWHQC